MNVYDNNREQYADEAKQRWGNTEAYKECKEKTADCSAEKLNDINEGLNAVFAEFADALRSGEAPESAASQSLVKKLQEYITKNFYNCTPEILKGLGQMYVADERFKNNIDKNGDGTAEFVSQAIEACCG